MDDTKCLSPRLYEHITYQDKENSDGNNTEEDAVIFNDFPNSVIATLKT
jgi:hypothetical protein